MKFPEKNQGNLHFECTKCGKCCTNNGDGNINVFVSHQDITEIAHFLQIPVSEAYDKYTILEEEDTKLAQTMADRLKLSLEELYAKMGLKEGMRKLKWEPDCIFFEHETRLCKIHYARPDQCWKYPYLYGYIENGEWTDEILGLCEGTSRIPIEKEIKLP